MKKQQETHPCARCGKPARKGYRYCYYCYLEVCDEMVASRYFTRHPAIEAPREQSANDAHLSALPLHISCHRGDGVLPHLPQVPTTGQRREASKNQGMAGERRLWHGRPLGRRWQ